MNPKAHRLFIEKANSERQRRSEAMKIILQKTKGDENAIPSTNDNMEEDANQHDDEGF